MTFTILAKPTGAICNLDCSYCFYLQKEKLYPGSKFRMSDEVLESYLKAYLGSHPGSQVELMWQGGEPTLMGLDFFGKAVTLAQRYKRAGATVHHGLQTNGIALDVKWCRFLKEHDFLVGLSLDGPGDCHDAYRVDKSGAGTVEKVEHAWKLLKEHGVETNILCTVHRANSHRALEVYRYFRDRLGARYLQFIPVVEHQGEGRVSERSVEPESWGSFLNSIFDEWVVRDVGEVFVQIFDSALAAWVGAPRGMCVFEENCGNALALEHNGDLYSCDHFVEPRYLLGNVQEEALLSLARSEAQREFGRAKSATLPQYCRECEVRFACNGECPRNRFAVTPDGEGGLNYLCAGYRAFFRRVNAPMNMMRNLYLQRKPPAAIKSLLKERFAASLPDEPCPCGAGRAFARCHGAD